jgi:hypothetical protein
MGARLPIGFELQVTRALRSSPAWLLWLALRKKGQAVQAVARQDGERFAEEYVETIERRYVDQLTLNVIEMRLRKN